MIFSSPFFIFMSSDFFPKFNSPVKQKGKLKIKRKYLLYYLLQFFAGARRQIFIVFATFMMVEKFGLHVHELTALFLINFCLNIIFAPIMGRVVQIFGERISLCIEYAGLTLVFLAYAGIYYWDWGVQIAVFLFIVDHLFFALSIAMKTYFQKIFDNLGKTKQFQNFINRKKVFNNYYIINA